MADVGRAGDFRAVPPGAIGWDGLTQPAANILLCSQMILLFQEKDTRSYGWLAVMSLLQVVVASRYSQGVAFGGLMIAYTIVGIFAISLLVLYGQWEHIAGRSRVGFSPPSEEGGLKPTLQRDYERDAGRWPPWNRDSRACRRAAADREW